jgi:hypothetical protein
VTPRGAQRLPVRADVLITGAALAAAAFVGAGLVRFGTTKMAALVAGGCLVALAFTHIEVLFALLYAVAFIGPALLGNGIWPPVMALIVVVIAARELVVGRRAPVLPGLLIAYSAVYVVVTLHGASSPSTFQAVRGYLTPVLLAMATATVARDPAIRRRLIVMAAPFVFLQIPVAAVQAAQGIQSYGRGGFDEFGDKVTGTLGGSASGTLSLVTVAFATFLLAAALERVWRPRLLYLGATVLALAGVLSVARAVFVFVPVAFAAVIVAGGYAARRSTGFRRIVTLMTIVVVAAPAFVFAMSALYPGVVNDINSSQKVRDYLFLPNNGASPERAGQLQLALSDVKRSGIDTELLGEGAGATWVNADPHLLASSDSPVVVRPEQFANSVWIPRIIVEAGALGLIAFLALLAFAARVGIRARRLSPSGTTDAAIGLALPGVAALTFVGGFYQTVLDLPPYGTLFWVVLGLGLAILASPQRPSGAAS